MHPYASLDRLHARVVRVPALRYFTALTRVLLAVAFLPSGLKKIANVRFTQLGVETPVGFFFEAFYRSGVWYQFIGWAQVAASLLLLVPRTAPLGAMLYFPIALNVALVTIGVGFSGTPIVTVLMALGALYLVCWEYDRWRALLPRWGVPPTPARAGGRIYLLSVFGWGAAGALAFAVAFVLGLGNVDRTLGARGFPLLVAMGGVFGLVVAWHSRRVDVRPADGAG
jgi:hypothetical protein